MTSLAAWSQQKQIAELSANDVVTASRVQPQGPDHTKRIPVVAEPQQFKILQTSLFDAVGKQIQPVLNSVEVQAEAESFNITAPRPIEVDGQEVITSAGTYGDISRYLQMLPGVAGTDDVSNQILVRGGHPLENLFLVDGIEIPNINHVTDSSSTGGFAPMIDAANIQGLSVRTGGFEAQYPERLSSVTEIRTLDSSKEATHLEADIGIEGVGGMAEKRIKGFDVLTSAHHGVLNLISNSIGLNDIPAYTNELTRIRHEDSTGNRLTVLNIAGWDGISVTPCAIDPDETMTIDSQYQGWRETTGAEFQHVYTARSLAVVTVSDSEQIAHISQQDQIINPLNFAHVNSGCDTGAATPVYQEDSNHAFSTGAVRYQWLTSRMTFTTGTSAWLQRPHYDVDQPDGAFSPYSATPTRADSTSFNANFSTGETGTFADLMVNPLKQLAVSAGGRLQTFAFGSHVTVTPRLGVRYHLGERASVHAAFDRYEQLPPYVYLLAYPQNRSLSPMRATHEIVGVDWGIRSSQVRFEAYNKQYAATPASTEYPAVSFHTQVEQLGQQFVWLPMNSEGQGNASGIELSDVTRIHSRIQLQGSIAYARAKFAGTDGVLRPSNYDFPWIANLAGVGHLGRKYTASARYGYETGRPYTPFDLSESLAQNRPIFDLTKVNALRAPDYSRLDVQVNREVDIKSSHLELYCGVDNILNHNNFLAYVWMPRAGDRSSNSISTLWQMPIFPNFGVRMVLR